VDLRVWTEILGSYRELSDLIARSFADPEAPLDLVALRGSMRRKLEALRVSLGAFMPAEQAVEVLVPLLFLFDERVLGRLGAISISRELAWPLLQRDLFPAEDGGDVFFERVDEVYRREDQTLLLEVYLFCLQAGFEGCYSDDPAAITRWKAKLAERVAVPALPSPPPLEATLPQADPAWLLALVTAGAIVALSVILFAIARAL